MTQTVCIREGQIVKRMMIQVHYIGLNSISLGVSLDLKLPNLEIHLPFLFIRIGRCRVVSSDKKQFVSFTSYRQICKEGGLEE